MFAKGFESDIGPQITVYFENFAKRVHAPPLKQPGGRLPAWDEMPDPEGDHIYPGVTAGRR